MSEVSETILKRIKNLLAMAADVGSPNEAAIATRRAEALMREYNLTNADVIKAELNTQLRSVFVKVGVNRKKAKKKYTEVPSWGSILAVAVARLFDCYAYIKTTQELGTVVMLAGHVTDVTVAHWTYEYLLDQINKYAQTFRDQTIHPRARKMVDDFRFHMSSELCRRLKELQAEKEAFEDQHEKSTALVVSKQGAIAQKFGAPSYKSKPRRSITTAALAGQAAGKEVNISKPISGPAAQKQLK